VKQIPCTTIVRRTRVTFPDEVLSRWLRREPRKTRPRNGRLPATDRTTDCSSRNPTEHGAGQPAFRSLCSVVTTIARNTWEAAFTTPDRYIWWMNPAVQEAARIARILHPQILYSTGPPHSVHLTAARIKRRTGLPWVMDLRDPWARSPWGLKKRNPWGQRLLGAMEHSCIRLASAVILNTERLRDEFVTYYGHEAREKFHVVNNGYDPQLLAHVEQSIGRGVATSVHGTAKGVIRVCHPGSLYGRRDPRPLLLAIRHLVDAGFPMEFHQIGECSPAFQVDRFVREQRLEEHVVLHGRVSHQTALEGMARADVLLVIQPDTALQVPSKVFEMLMFRKPIVALTGSGETADLVTTHRLGAVAPPRDAASVAQAMKQAIAMRPLNAGAWDRALTRFDGRTLTGHLARILDRECRGSRTAAIPWIAS
jgi:glycosyltransferase involved in cell wall biosynthesis